MKKLTLKRISESEDVTMGVLLYEGLPFLMTLEDPWRNNEINISCIREGLYVCSPYSSKKFPNTYYVCNVPGRTNILIHVGNTTDDTSGCILVGRYFGVLGKKRAVLSSRFAMEDLRELIGDNRFELAIEGGSDG